MKIYKKTLPQEVSIKSFREMLICQFQQLSGSIKFTAKIKSSEISIELQKDDDLLFEQYKIRNGDTIIIAIFQNAEVFQALNINQGISFTFGRSEKWVREQKITKPMENVARLLRLQEGKLIRQLEIKQKTIEIEKNRQDQIRKSSSDKKQKSLSPSPSKQSFFGRTDCDCDNLQIKLDYEKLIKENAQLKDRIQESDKLIIYYQNLVQEKDKMITLIQSQNDNQRKEIECIHSTKIQNLQSSIERLILDFQQEQQNVIKYKELLRKCLD